MQLHNLHKLKTCWETLTTTIGIPPGAKEWSTNQPPLPLAHFSSTPEVKALIGCNPHPSVAPVADEAQDDDVVSLDDGSEGGLSDYEEGLAELLELLG